MHDACGMGVRQRFRDGNHCMQHLVRGPPAVLGEIATSEVLHRDPGLAPFAIEAVDAHNVRMDQRFDTLAFARERLALHSIARHLGCQQLERNMPAQLAVLSEPDFPDGALPEGTNQCKSCRQLVPAFYGHGMP